MSAQGRISVFVRIRPHNDRDSGLVQTSDDKRTVTFAFGDESPSFHFNRVFAPEDDQEEIFERCAAPSVRSALDGYNATVFAYGQTGSGKTWTITGGTKKYSTRGIIPRALALVC